MNRRNFTKLIGLSLIVPFALPVGPVEGLTVEKVCKIRNNLRARDGFYGHSWYQTMSPNILNDEFIYVQLTKKE